MSGYPTELRIVQSPEGQVAGTYGFCAKCASGSNCCSRVTPSGEIDPPVLFSSDVEAIEQFTGKRADSFSNLKDVATRSERVILLGSKGCFFYRDGKCSIYAVRPVDCRLFPVDIIEKPDGRLVWIAYTSLCPVSFDPRAQLDHARRLLPLLGENVRAYARMETDALDRASYVELGDVESDKLTRGHH